MILTHLFPQRLKYFRVQIPRAQLIGDYQRIFRVLVDNHSATSTVFIVLVHSNRRAKLLCRVG